MNAISSVGARGSLEVPLSPKQTLCSKCARAVAAALSWMARIFCCRGRKIPPKTISFVGGGNLARALISGLRKNGYPGAQIVVSNRTSGKLEKLAADFGITPAATNLEAARRADILVIAVKPQDVQWVAREIKEAVQAKTPLIISLAAGIKMEMLDEWLGSGLSLVRTMPNTATLIGKGLTALYANLKTTEEQKKAAESFFNMVGESCWVQSERKLDLMTPFIGSGIAYLYIFIEAMQEAARKNGIDPAIVNKLARQTVHSAAEMALKPEESLEHLISQVATPGGVTEPSLAVLRGGGLFRSLEESFKIVADRCGHLAERLGRADPSQPG